MRALALLLLFVVSCGSPTATQDPTAAPQPTAQATTEAQRTDPCASIAAFSASAPALRAFDLARAFLDTCGRARVLELTSTLVSFPTVSSQLPDSRPAFDAMARYLETFSAQHGLRWSKIGDHDAWEITLGQGQRQLAFVAHADVVPAASDLPKDGSLPVGWSKPPFAATLEGDRLYGRGTEDDKGPIATALVVMAALAGAEVVPNGVELALIIGTGEESDWEGMQRYVGSRSPPHHVISIDSSFPLVVGEAGFVSWSLAVPLLGHTSQGKALIVEAKAGEFLSQLPGDATMTLRPASRETPEQLYQRVLEALAAEDAARGGVFGLQASLESGGTVVVHVTGEAVHSATAEKGKNALWVLASLAQRLNVEGNGYAALLKLVAKKLDGEHTGAKLGLAYSDPVMGALLVAPTVFAREDDHALLRINMRRPAGITSAAFAEKLDATMKKLQREIDPRLYEAGERYVGEPHFVGGEHALARTLLDIYRKRMNQPDAAPITIRGGTYARLFPGAVSFGPALPGKPYRGHAPDEYLEVAAIDAMLSMYFDASTQLLAPPVTQTAGPP